MKLKTNERSRRRETDDLMDFTGSKGWFFLPGTFVRQTGLSRSGGEENLYILPK